MTTTPDREGWWWCSMQCGPWEPRWVGSTVLGDWPEHYRDAAEWGARIPGPEEEPGMPPLSAVFDPAQMEGLAAALDEARGHASAVELELASTRANLAEMAGQLADIEGKNFASAFRASEAEEKLIDAKMRLAEVERERDTLRTAGDAAFKLLRARGHMTASNVQLAENALHDALFSAGRPVVAEPRDEPELPSDWQRYQKGEYRQGSFYLRLSRGGVWFSSGNDDEGPCCASSVPLNVLRLILRDAGYAPHPSGTEGPLREALRSIPNGLDTDPKVPPEVKRWVRRWADAALAASPPDGTAPERAADDRAVIVSIRDGLAKHFEEEAEEYADDEGIREGLLKAAELLRTTGMVAAEYGTATRPPDGMPGEPDDDSGVGFSIVDGLDESGEMRMRLDVRGHIGDCWLSREMWQAVGEHAGWASPPDGTAPGVDWSFVASRCARTGDLLGTEVDRELFDLHMRCCKQIDAARTPATSKPEGPTE